MHEVVNTANQLTADTFKQLEDQIKSTNEMVLELRVLLERKDKQLQAVRILRRVPAAYPVPCTCGVYLRRVLCRVL